MQMKIEISQKELELAVRDLIRKRGFPYPSSIHFKYEPGDQREQTSGQFKATAYVDEINGGNNEHY